MISLHDLEALKKRADRLSDNVNNNSLIKSRSPIKQSFVKQPTISIDDIIQKGKIFYASARNNDTKIPIITTLQKALDYIENTGYIATLPELIKARIKSGKEHNFGNKWYTAHTEENIGIDRKEKFYKAGEQVFIIVNGGGLLTPSRMTKAYDENLIDYSTIYSQDEIDNLLDGKLADGSKLRLYHFDEEIMKGVSHLPHQYGIIIPYSVVQKTKSGYQQKKEFLTNPLVIARAGGQEHLEAYYEIAKDNNADLGCWYYMHYQKENPPTGYILYMSHGLDGIENFNSDSRFIGINKSKK